MIQPDYKKPSEFTYLDLHALDKLAQSPHAAVVAKPLAVFQKNLRDIKSVGMAPVHAAAFGAHGFYWTIGYYNSAIRDGKILDLANKGEEKARIAAADEWLKTYFAKEESVTELAGLIKSTMVEMEKKEEFRDSLITINQVSLPAVWMAFECLCHDMWIASLNEGSTSVAHRAFQLLEGDELTRKYIPISELAKNGFDLRNKVGAALEAKYDFTGLDGIVKAYSVLDENFTLGPDDLLKSMTYLEKTRHLIMHRAGYVDAKYKRESKCSEEVGDKIKITPEKLSQLVTATIQSAQQVVELVDRILGLASNPLKSDPNPLTK